LSLVACTHPDASDICIALGVQGEPGVTYSTGRVQYRPDADGQKFKVVMGTYREHPSPKGNAHGVALGRARFFSNVQYLTPKGQRPFFCQNPLKTTIFSTFIRENKKNTFLRTSP